MALLKMPPAKMITVACPVACCSWVKVIEKSAIVSGFQ
jgi:hypothetical protein